MAQKKKRKQRPKCETCEGITGGGLRYCYVCLCQIFENGRGKGFTRPRPNRQQTAATASTTVPAPPENPAYRPLRHGK